LFQPATITYLLANPSVFGIADLKGLKIEEVKNISLYRSLLLANEEIEDKLQKTLSDFESAGSFTGSEATLAELWEQPQSLIKSLLSNLTLGKPALSAMDQLWTALKICTQLGIQGDSLKKLISSNYKEAAEVALGAFASKYEDEKTREEKLAPTADKINTLKRDALCDYIISRGDKFKFKDRRDLYEFFLLDVEMGGCFRTSYLVAAITSLQLYVYRCLINLEQSDKSLNANIPDVKVLPTYIPADEWEWRKNYRVWEANRKVFLYPENYIDPTLRDTKTHIFKELEDELLQQKITEESAQAAYKKYMAQFAELTRLRYAGAYYHEEFDNYGYVNLGGSGKGDSNFFMVSGIYFPSESDDSCYYLFARTNVMPYQYYYRTYNDNRKTWGNWTKIELGIEAKEISAIIHQGRLHIFWTEVKAKEMNTLNDGSSNSEGYVFSAYVKYSYLGEGGRWSAPQRLYVGQGNDTKQKIYGRVRTSNFNQGRWDKEKDAMVETYEERVFRKPYAYAGKNDISTPIRMAYIWSQNKGSQEVTYTTASANVKFSFVEFSVPSRSFKITNNDFSQASTEIQVSLTMKLPGLTYTVNVKGDLKLTQSGCTFQINQSGIALAIPIGFSVQATSMPVTENNFSMSLSRNVITNPAESNIFSGGNLSYHKKEYLVAYTENGDMNTYIENGMQQMSDHRLTQDRNGLGGIHINKNSESDFVPVNTILTDELCDVLYAKGLDEFLSLKTQEMTDPNGQKFNFRGPYGEYYWEIFFHIPFLIANHFNANQKFKEAKWWYERVFNPTSDEAPANSKPTDHNWQFREFRGLTAQKLKDILTDVKAIEAYKKDPFDPHAIARLRISAYQKAIVMKYIDNIIDWGDQLFTQDTRESINEAEMLYHFAYNILGKKPVKRGKCATADEEKLTYEKVGPEISKGAEFLITLENVYWTQRKTYQAEVGLIQRSKSLMALNGNLVRDVNLEILSKQVQVQRGTDLDKVFTPPANTNPVKDRVPVTGTWKSYKTLATTKSTVTQNKGQWMQAQKPGGRVMVASDKLVFKPQKRYPSYDVVRQAALVFCVPENKDLLEYWTRLDDRLMKIWNCMNIYGVRRSLSLFQPPIDPMMLVR
ncbi:MAG TPA: neuraminidase-like domain-containing protein, partial [Flavisolibacter sp.]